MANNTDNIVPFVSSLFAMLEDPELESVIAWNQDGTTFKVMRVRLFQSIGLKKYFNHQKFQSFHRQLNKYGFKRQYGGDFVKFKVFARANFVRGRPDLLNLV